MASLYSKVFSATFNWFYGFNVDVSISIFLHIENRYDVFHVCAWIHATAQVFGDTKATHHCALGIVFLNERHFENLATFRNGFDYIKCACVHVFSLSLSLCGWCVLLYTLFTALQYILKNKLCWLCYCHDVYLFEVKTMVAIFY